MRNKELKTYCYDPEMIQFWQEMETKYAAEPDLTSDNMVGSLVEKFGEDCIPIKIKVLPDAIETTFKLNWKGELQP